MADGTDLPGSQFDAVLFDLDGTLIDSTPVVERTWERWARQYGLAPGTWRVQHGVPARQTLAELVPPADLDEQFALLENLEATDLDGVTVLPGAHAALAALPAGRAAIVTSGTRPLAEARIRHTLLPAPSVVVTASDVEIGKPDPAPYLLAARLLGADPARCLVVEDAPAGLAAGQAAGCRTLALATSHSLADFRAYGVLPDAMIPDLSAVTFTAGGRGVTVSRPDDAAFPDGVRGRGV